MYRKNLCPFVCQADFECFCVTEYKNEDEENEDNNNDTNTASSSNECPPHLQKNRNAQQEKLGVIMRQVVIQVILK